jgi:hypothetical protein
MSKPNAENVSSPGPPRISVLWIAIPASAVVLWIWVGEWLQPEQKLLLKETPVEERKPTKEEKLPPVAALPVTLTVGTDQAAVEAVQKAPRAVVLLTVKWSFYPYRVKQDFFPAVEYLRKHHQSADLQFFLLEEDAEPCKQWFENMNSPLVDAQLGVMGAGSLLWLENGKVVDFQLSGGELTSADMIARTLKLWKGK